MGETIVLCTYNCIIKYSCLLSMNSWVRIHPSIATYQLWTENGVWSRFEDYNVYGSLISIDILLKRHRFNWTACTESHDRQCVCCKFPCYSWRMWMWFDKAQIVLCVIDSNKYDLFILFSVFIRTTTTTKISHFRFSGLCFPGGGYEIIANKQIIFVEIDRIYSTNLNEQTSNRMWCVLT